MLARVALESELQQLVDTSAEEAGKATRALEQRIDALEGDMQRGGLDDVIEAVEAAKALKARVVALEVKERGGCMDEVFERLSSVEKEVKDCSRGLDEAVTLHAAGIERCRSSLIAEGVRSGKLEERMRSMEEMLETEIEKRETGLDHVREEVHTLEGRFDTETQKRVARLDSIGERVGVLEGGLETDTRKRETELNSIGKRLDGLAERLEAEALKYDGWVGERLDGLDRRLLELEGGLASEMSRSKADQDKLCRLEGEEETRQSEWNARLRFLQERVEVMGTPKRSDLQPQPEEQRAQTPRTPLQFV